MTRRDDVQAAYFQLLRAREELDHVRRFAEYVEDERRRMRRVRSETEASADRVPARLRRVLRPADEQLAQALERRAGVLDDEARRLPDRIAAAQEFVVEAEREHDALRRQA